MSAVGDIEEALVAHWSQFGRSPKGYLSLAGPPGVAAIFGMSVPPEARRRGIAAGMTTTLLQRARREGCTRAVLHSTAMAAGVYRRAGFAERCPLTIFATTPLFSHGP